jgi:hypothetical protein
VGGIPGALLAVPIAACANAVVKYLAGRENDPTEAKDHVEQQLDADQAAADTVIPSGDGDGRRP